MSTIQFFFSPKADSEILLPLAIHANSLLMFLALEYDLTFQIKIELKLSESLIYVWF